MRKNILILGSLALMVFGLSSIPTQADFILCPGDGCSGTEFADLILGSPVLDDVDAGEGDDVVFLGEGDDQGDGQEGNDFVFGGAGSDEVEGEEGNDHLSAGPDAPGFSQLMGGQDGNDNYYVFASEVTACLIINEEADAGADAAHLVGFGPYVAVSPFGMSGFIDGYVHVIDPITGGDILIFVVENGDTGVEVINGLQSPNVTILAGDDPLVEECFENLPEDDD